MMRCKVDHSVYYRHDGKDLAIIVTAVDDLTIIMSSTELMSEVKSKLKEAFEITDMGEIHWLLGMEIK